MNAITDLKERRRSLFRSMSMKGRRLNEKSIDYHNRKRSMLAKAVAQPTLACRYRDYPVGLETVDSYLHLPA